MLWRSVCVWFVGCLLCVDLTGAASDDRRQAGERVSPKVGLVLSGGGAKGAAHVGVIRVLEELGVPIDLVVGTSMGAIVGGLYASGLSAAELEKAVLDIDWVEVFDDEPPRAQRSLRRKRDDADFLVRYRLGIKDGQPQLPRGVILGQKLMLALRKLSARGAHSDFDRMRYPFRAVAADLETGEAVVLGAGSLALAMRASMSVPGVFPPVEYEGRLLIDGGVANNLPIDVARAMGADIVIAVNVQTDPKARDDLRSVVSIIDQTVNLLILRETRRQIGTLTPDDLLIQPELGEIGSGDFLRAHEAITSGERAAREIHARLDDVLAGLVRRRPAGTGKEGFHADEAPVLRELRIEHDTPLHDQVLGQRLQARVGEPLVLDRLEKDISRIYGLGLFESVDYRWVGPRRDGILVVNARRKATGLNSLRFGLNLESDFAGDSGFNIGLDYEMTAINALGAEWRTELVFGDRLKLATEFYQPLDYASRWFVDPQFGYEEENVNLFDGGQRVAEIRVKTAVAGLDLGLEFGSCCEVRVGVRAGYGELEQISGALTLPVDDFDIGLYTISVTHDTLDSTRFPRSGTLAFIAYSDSNAGLGADFESRFVNISAISARSWGAHTLLGQLKLDINVDAGGQVQDLFSLGGFLNLSGFQRNELSGEHAALLGLSYYRRYSNAGSALDIPVYVGASLEYGGVFTEIEDFASDEAIAAGALFMGADTPIGPLYIGYGLAEGGNRAAYLFLGQTF